MRVCHHDTPVHTEDTTSLQPSPSRLQVANPCEDGRAHSIHLFVFKHSLNILVWMCSCLHAPTLFCFCGIYQSGTSTSLSPDGMLVVNVRWGGRCARHDGTSSVSKACSLAVSMFWQAPRRTQNHWNRRRRVVGKTGSDIHVAITWISVRFQGRLWRGVRSLCRGLLFAFLLTSRLKHPHHWRQCRRTGQRSCFAKLLLPSFSATAPLTTFWKASSLASMKL